ncbi:hypothetical protein OAS14_04700 [Alphaproteobacteria bacterium]|nr:hypothetical protein [Alphaproteobacteria bacterium]
MALWVWLCGLGSEGLAFADSLMPACQDFGVFQSVVFEGFNNVSRHDAD